jgi:hypothetical protein
LGQYSKSPGGAKNPPPGTSKQTGGDLSGRVSRENEMNHTSYLIKEEHMKQIHHLQTFPPACRALDRPPDESPIGRVRPVSLWAALGLAARRMTRRAAAPVLGLLLALGLLALVWWAAWDLIVGAVGQ